jgi:two-component system, NarL family, sensor kinase
MNFYSSRYRFCFLFFLGLLFSCLFHSPLSAQSPPPSTADSINYTPEQIAGFIRHYKAQNDLRGLAWCEEAEARYNFRVFGPGRYPLEHYTKALGYFETLNDQKNIGRVNKLIGENYDADPIYRKLAINYYQKAKDAFEEAGNKAGAIDAELALLNAQIDNPFDKEEDKLANENAQKRQKEANDLYKRIDQLAMACKNSEDHVLLARAYVLQAQQLIIMNRPIEAMQVIDLSLELAKALNAGAIVADASVLKGLILKNNKQARQALEYLEEGLRLTRSYKKRPRLYNISLPIAECYQVLGQYEAATRYYKEAYRSRHLSANRDALSSARYLDDERKLDDTERERAELQKNKKNQTTFSVGIGLLALTLAGLAFLLYKGRKRDKTISEQQKIIDQQRIKELEYENTRNLVDAQEKERSRTARELHDGLGAMLSRIKHFVEANSGKVPANTTEDFIDPLKQYIDEACSETRVVSNNLQPYALTKFGFTVALEDLATKSQRAQPGIDFNFQHYGEEPVLSPESSSMLYRVVQELLNNAIKHSKAAQVDVQVFYDTDKIDISVEDNGQGFDPSTLKPGNGLGNIRYRIEYLYGQVTWDSQPGHGTTVMITVPLKKQSA